MRRFSILLAALATSLGARAHAQTQDAILRSSQQHVIPRMEHTGFMSTLSLAQSMMFEAQDGDITIATLGLRYRFNRDYSLGAHGSYRWPYQQDLNGYNGAGDLSFSFIDHSLYELKEHGFRIEGKLAYIVPISDRSYKSSLKSGIEATLKALKGFNRRLKVEIETSVGNFAYEYDTKETLSPKQVYNAPFVWGNSVGVFTKLAENVRWAVSAATKTSYNYDNNQVFLATLSTGPTWEIIDDLSVDALLKTSNRAGGAEASSDGGDARSSNFFDSSTTGMSFGARYVF